MIINHNISAINAHRQLGVNQNGVQGSLEKLSSGLQINRAGDDAAGLAISEKMRGQIRGLEQASTNAQDGISLIQTAEGALNETHEILQRMRELAVQSSNDSNTDADRAELQKEVDQLTNALNDISKNTEFNTKGLLDGSFEGTFHVGANQDQNLSLSIGDMSGNNLGVSQTLTVGEDGAIEGFVYSEGQEAKEYQINGTGELVIPGTAAVDVEYTVEHTYETPGDTSSNVTASRLVDSNGDELATWQADPAGDASEPAGYYNAAGDLIATASAVDTLDDGEEGTHTIPAVQEGTAAWQAADETAGTVAGYYNDSNELVLESTKELKAGSEGTTKEIKAGYYDAETGSLRIEGEKKAQGDDPVTLGQDISSQDKANESITTIQSAIDNVSAERSKLGAVQNRLEHTINNLGASSENMTAAESRIRDVDMAKEMMEFTKNNILSQAAQSMLAQSQQIPQGVLQLLQ
ncbi:flagellin [Oceanobacillus oncorhynchi subsp. incaldanensis]|uniref:flagellin N-terminal helical domain-containing protein n=1 Tax=Oceanobacillus oncorhynchi TaxID=545501 RepID=UPI001B13E2DE|nr:flagellin [Oceanobacillus oncorhynchi]GIO18073.1 flagellin [Oceanobacillus oncorhynchi subsp. incaldanensis]